MIARLIAPCFARSWGGPATKYTRLPRAEEAVEKAREVRPHIVILDVNLPDLNGFAVCRAIRADREIATVPVLMLTVRHDDSDVLAGLEAGADDYVAKDSAGEIILGRVRRLIQFRQMSTMAMLNQQLVQVGRLLAGIIHEIRGPLSVIRSSAELLMLEGSTRQRGCGMGGGDPEKLSDLAASPRSSGGGDSEQLVGCAGDRTSFVTPRVGQFVRRRDYRRRIGGSRSRPSAKVPCRR